MSTAALSTKKLTPTLPLNQYFSGWSSGEGTHKQVFSDIFFNPAQNRNVLDNFLRQKASMSSRIFFEKKISIYHQFWFVVLEISIF